MNILVITNLYPPDAVGGYEQLCHDVATELIRRGHDVTVLTSNYGGRVVAPEPHVLRHLRLLATPTNIYQPIIDPCDQGSINADNLRALKLCLDSVAPEIVFAWNLYFLDSSFLEALLLSTVPVVFELTDNWMVAQRRPHFLNWYWRTNPGNGVRSLFDRLRMPATVTETIPHYALFSSRFMQTFYSDAGLTFKQSRVIYHGVKALAAYDRDRARLAHQDKPKLLVAGRIVRLKGVHTAIQALPKIVSALPHAAVSLTVLGDDTDREYSETIRSMVSREMLPVSFSPPVALDRLGEVFSDHDVLLFPSLYEPFSLTLVHALQSGMPVIASAAGGNREIVRHKWNGWLFRPGDHASLAQWAIRALSDGATRNSISGRAKRSASPYTVDRMMDEIERQLSVWVGR